MSESNTYFIQHFGVKGMRWGVRRKSSGGRSSVSSETAAKLRAAKRREEILKSPKKLYKHRAEFTDQEINDAMAKMRMERSLKQLAKQDIDRGKNYVKEVIDVANTGVKAYETYEKVKVIADKVKKAQAVKKAAS